MYKLEKTRTSSCLTDMSYTKFCGNQSNGNIHGDESVKVKYKRLKIITFPTVRETFRNRTPVLFKCQILISLAMFLESR